MEPERRKFQLALPSTVSYILSATSEEEPLSMKRDMGLIRDILIAVESREPPTWFEPVKVEGRGKAEVEYHVGLLIQAGLLKGTSMVSAEYPDGALFVRGLTWEGHDFIDAARNDTVWGRLQAKTAELGGPLPFDVAKALVLQYTKELLIG